METKAADLKNAGLRYSLRQPNPIQEMIVMPSDTGTVTKKRHTTDQPGEGLAVGFN